MNKCHFCCKNCCYLFFHCVQAVDVPQPHRIWWIWASVLFSLSLPLPISVYLPRVDSMKILLNEIIWNDKANGWEKRHPLHFNVINGFRGNSAVKVKMCCCNAVFWWDFFTMCVCAHARTRSANVLAHQKRRVTPISFAECWIFMVWATRMGFILR